MNLFTNKSCVVCGKGFLPKGNSTILADGFQDQDTSEMVHFGNCQKEHYKSKSKKGMRGLYSEVPLML